MTTTTASNGRTRGLRVLHEPLTYERRAPQSYFRDLALARANGSRDAQQRLDQHAREMTVVMPKIEREARMAPGLEYRVNPSTRDGQGGDFAPPRWLIEHFATAPRAKRVLAGLLPGFPLPEGASEIKLPRMTTGTVAGTPVDGAPVPSQDVVSAAVESNVTTLDGMSDWSLQSLEQSPPGAHLDWAIFKDLTEATDTQLEEKLFTGSGSGQEITGILKLTTGSGAVSAVTLTAGSPKATEVFTALGKVGAQLGDARKAPPELWLMRTARWSWLGSGQDKQERPIDTPDEAPDAPTFTLDGYNGPEPVASWLGWPIYPADAIPASLGAAGNQDAVIALRPSDQMLFESEPVVAVDQTVLSGTLGVRFGLHRRAAALWRYPTGIATLGGTGLVVQSEY
jgi:HK97 family phage major capsid protein